MTYRLPLLPHLLAASLVLGAAQVNAASAATTAPAAPANAAPANAAPAASATVSTAERVAMRPDITLGSAKRLIDATMQVCHAAGKTLVVAVVDRSGNLVALQRDDDVGPHNTLAAQRKAYTALSTKTATRVLADSARANPQSQNLNTIAELLLIGGGVPIRSGAAVIGAIGVAGAGGAAMDESCALTAIERIFHGNG